jgi:signal transduction histidine kinase/ActR/RegA family two-component response regulator
VVTAVLEREAMFLERDDDLRRWPEIAVPPISVEQHGPLAVVPLIVQGRSVGAISWRYGRVRRIDDDERAMLMMIARYAAQALERARLYESERRARREAEQSEARALDADRRKDEFLAMLGHELRNPLAPILTALQLMRLRGGPAHERERAVIERQVHHLMRLVNDLLDVSRITRGRIQLQAASLDLKAVIARAVEIAAPVLEARAHRLDVRVPDHPLLVHGDAARLSQALSNVLNNAAKYTEPGGDVVVQAFREAGEVVVRVRDSGIGIDSGMLSRIFDLFVQDQRNLDRSQGGLGVGLTIVRSLVELHGGKVSASSDGPGRGSEFEIRLPALEDDAVEALAEPRAPEAPIRTNSEARVLIVDDNVDAASVLADALRDVGYDARIAHDGPAGIEVARTFRPRVVLLDIGLPIVDGYQVAARLRAECAAAPLALVALTGYGQSADRARAKMAGFDEHLVKPVELRSVLEVLERLTSAVPPDGV